MDLWIVRQWIVGLLDFWSHGKTIDPSSQQSKNLLNPKSFHPQKGEINHEILN